ncbi:TPA: exodeoxyribonuclease V subunit beta [Haemophilus influenzae]|uniref:exodeoxyribonuclease V subunit beta n=2 Tax=Haemophilus influenzae TaxID=727 RepID=UPI00068149FF|nr:exodeoxyribonuclease V subunit beta [Haemophilus influenzae]AVJ03914.1 exodeoxyribonuclease V, beta subunit [Haemophilus influenzae]AVJ05520.1 exodeoxyribonuclease V, beta subunit [Haemophilus influenzae]KMZ35865.1 exodeoxyribonuclease V subunit beta [Haemophilus influenzae]MCK8799768.1 exodeoxyribonuclease V subunit beta [Haemophilus influenzae]MCK8890226.1 exodeoxyribonuclease V subunit beta [Haemophilus influenzae]
MAETIPLNPITLPLNQISLIEASAGTGKTYTIGSLYLRLLLKAGENNFSRPLNVEEILVVTFTEMATEELKKKIRERITDAINNLTAFAKTQDKSAFKNDEFLTALSQGLDIFEAIHRLKLAEQNMDLAAIYTIHGFCRRMLMQYAFHSGIHFNLELIKDQSDLLVRFSNEFWREHFYPLDFESANFIATELVSPANVLSLLKADLGKDLQVEIENKQALSVPIQIFLQQYLGGYQKALNELKAFWLESADEISAIITNELEKNYPKDQLKSLNRKKYQVKRLGDWINKINQWSNNPRDYQINTTLKDYFLQSSIEKNCEESTDKNKDKKPATPFYSPIFAELEKRVNALMTPDLLSKLTLYHYRQGLQQKLLDYKLNHQEKSFDDLLRLLCEALQGAQGDELAEMIRFQYPFAMIDEFQDTDSQQYIIFSKIYRDNPEKNTGFIMIGDPKQAIYRFRGADIFTYLKASDEAQSRFELTKNYRSEKNLVDGVNALFDFPQSPFIYQNINFTAVDSRDDHLRFYLNGKAEPAYRFYLTESDKVNKTEMAKICAISIQHWLKSAVENQAVFQNEDTCKTLQAANIAVLVRDKNEAALVKNELQKLGIASVYLSDQNSVFDSNVAKELAWVLKACLNVAERPILNAIATALFGLNAADIHQIQQNEAYWQRWADSFAQYQQTWQRQGILAMLHQILLEQGISERLLSQATGERDLTDFLHLAEILQQAATLHESEAALLSWFEKQIQGEGRQEAQIRLESERQLVKIVSIHKSKGLEYDLVWLPFLAAPSKDPSKKDINIYYSKERDETLWDIENRNLNALCEETFAEELRLLYVALTRAKYQMAFALPTQFDKKWNALHYVLSQGEIGKEIALSVPKDTETLLQTFKEKMQDNVKICTKPNLEAFPALSINTKNDDFKAAEFTGNIEQDWRITSFTSIEQAHRRQNYFTESAGKKHAVFDDAKDYDSQNSIEISTALLNESESSILDLPRGKQVGTALHRHFENCYFSDLANTEEIDKLRQSLQLDETFTEPLQNWLQQISHTPLSNEIGIALADLANKDCIKEMPFYLAIRAHFDVEAFNRALKAHHHLPSEPLQFEQIQGMVRGSIDLVFRHNGKYYLVDYKSNFLGSTLASYNQEALKKEMLHSHYDWQYLIYTLALHRYLKNVLPRYDYDRNFGGVFYLFLRGMNGEPQSGVFYDRPSVELITELDGVF